MHSSKRRIIGRASSKSIHREGRKNHQGMRQRQNDAAREETQWLIDDIGHHRRVESRIQCAPTTLLFSRIVSDDGHLSDRVCGVSEGVLEAGGVVTRALPRVNDHQSHIIYVLVLLC